MSHSLSDTGGQHPAYGRLVAVIEARAHGGVGVRQTARQRRQHWQRIDSIAAEYVRLEKRLAHATSMLRKAEERER